MCSQAVSHRSERVTPGPVGDEFYHQSDSYEGSPTLTNIITNTGIFQYPGKPITQLLQFVARHMYIVIGHALDIEDFSAKIRRHDSSPNFTTGTIIPFSSDFIEVPLIHGTLNLPVQCTKLLET